MSEIDDAIPLFSDPNITGPEGGRQLAQTGIGKIERQAIFEQARIDPGSCRTRLAGRCLGLIRARQVRGYTVSKTVRL